MHFDLTFTSAGLTLEGRLELPVEGQAPFPGVAVCHPHPQYGGDMWNTVVIAVCEGLVAQGIAALRFNFRGVGGSEGSYDEGGGEQADVLAALAYLETRPEVAADRVGLAGYSFGGAMALAAFPQSKTARVLGLVAPPARGLDSASLRDPRPKLIIAGDMDHVAPAPQVEAITARVARACTVEALPGADHFYAGYEKHIASRIGSFFAPQLS